MQVWFENIFAKPATLEYSLCLPDGWTAQPAAGKLRAAPGEKAVRSFQLSIPAGESTAIRRRAFTLDATLDGRPLGQIAEALVDLRPVPASGTDSITGAAHAHAPTHHHGHPHGWPPV
jgi:hypothetical protein